MNEQHPLGRLAEHEAELSWSEVNQINRHLLTLEPKAIAFEHRIDVHEYTTSALLHNSVMPDHRPRLEKLLEGLGDG
ncbi:hypothetical protein [Marinobacter sp.]|uniref:hypothetical protein n=1 Tax=Marinobacter sp. TaxID=50741 RepID=UPI003A912313